jgi:hypothetical protein
MTHANVKAPARALERKDDTGTGGGTGDNAVKELKDFMGAFEEFKSTNDDRLKEIEKKGAADPLIDDKLSKINKSLDAFEDLNSRVTKAEKTADEVKKIDERFDVIETLLKP